MPTPVNIFMEDFETPLDLTTEGGVVEQMKRSKTEDQWNKNCDRVKTANKGQYPDFWYKSVILSGVAKEVADKFNK